MVDYTKLINTDIQFRDQSSNNPTSWSWNFGDGTTSTLKDPKKKYTTTGIRTVSMNSTNSCGTCALASKTVDVVESLPGETSVIWIVGAIVAAGIAAFLLTRKKK